MQKLGVSINSLTKHHIKEICKRMGLLLTDQEAELGSFEHKTQGLWKAIPRPGEVDLVDDGATTLNALFEWIIVNSSSFQVYRKNMDVWDWIFGVI